MNLSEADSAQADAPKDIDREAIQTYLGALFGTVEWDGGQSIALRGLGEKGTPREGEFREQVWVDWSPPDGGASAIAQHAARWNTHGNGAFIIPAVMAPSSMGMRRQTEADVAALTSVVVDLDNPDTAEDSLVRLEGALGPAGMVVESSPGKLHAYWLLDEPEADVQRVARVRHLLALKSGGDPSFQRVPQVIRIPGTDHGKNGGRFRVWLRHCNPDSRHSLWRLEEALEAMAPLPWASDTAREMAAQGGLNLAGMSDGGWTARERLAQPVHAGGEGAATRFDAATQVFGHYVHAVRTGAVASVDEARDLAHGWMLANMVPPWPEARFLQEWNAIVGLDAARHGPLVAPAKLWGSGEVSGPAQDSGILAWAVNRWVGTEAPPARKWLVKGLIRTGATHVLASAGGVGKTFALLDLCLGIACPQGSPDGWLGQALDPDNTGGTAVLLTAEDDEDELRIRIHALDQQGRRFAGADKCLVVPLAQAGGAFPLVEMQNGVAQPSASWRRMMDTLAEIPDLQFVAIDTLSATLHGEENSSVVIQQYMTALSLLRGRVPRLAALVTHHVRKSGARDAPIQSAQDMRQAIRGSNALESSARMVLGIWQPADYADRMKRMGLEPKGNTLFSLAVVKGNNPEAMPGERVLLRAPHGGLMDYTARATDNTDRGRQNTWLVWSIRRAAEIGKPLSLSTVWKMRDALPQEVDDIGKDHISDRLRELVRAKRIVFAETGKNNQTLLDVPGGPIASLTPDGLYTFERTPGVFDIGTDTHQYVATIGQVVPL